MSLFKAITRVAAIYGVGVPVTAILVTKIEGGKSFGNCMVGAIVGIVWPISLPLYVGNKIADKLERTK